MRNAYHEQLDTIQLRLVDMTQAVSIAMALASRSLLERELHLAEQVIANDAAIDEMNRDIEDQSLELMALQNPVASDLRAVMNAARMSSTLERMGDLAAHVAKVARMRYPDTAIPEFVRPILSGMADAAIRSVTHAGQVIVNKDPQGAEELVLLDDELDTLNRQLYATLLSPDWTLGVDRALDLALLARFYERFGDHAVSLARRVHQEVTGHRMDKF